ncbi:MAG: hydantoinase B/oxoprolinase family protein [Pseudanabaenaceae cyanobacterium bins.39]|nr:hydantoinase B/oxoprolinase family protein [Pseudanabaenaceae cyanobacterium bins.39]
MLNLTEQKWQFWIDRGGTFTDIVAQSPDRQIIVHKLLSENPQRYPDAPIQGIRDILGIAANAPIPVTEIATIKMGTTVATNALLERKGDRTVLLITQGFHDALRIGYQNRPHIFAKRIILPTMLYERVIEITERIDAHGQVLIPINLDQARQELELAYQSGIRSCAIALMHSYRYPQHEQALADIAHQIGFTQISASSVISPLIKFIHRADTAIVDAYLSPILQRYVTQFKTELLKYQPPISDLSDRMPQIMFMQSNGGLTDAASFQGKNSILSGPAGGIVGAVQTALQEGFTKIISFDMGGTSTDVAHYAGTYERSLHTEVAGVRLSTPMMAIHTVAAGGGSLLSFDGARYRVGPASAGAFPGPACYRHGGALAVTDCNVMLGKLQPAFFPAIFGKDGNLPIDSDIVRQKFQDLATEIAQVTGTTIAPEQVATGFLEIAVEKMAMAIKKISIQRGYDISDYVLCCFGGAGGQHACAIADVLGIQQILIHPYAGVLSAYGIGLADVRTIRDRSVEVLLSGDLMPELGTIAAQLQQEAITAMMPTDLLADGDRLRMEIELRLRYLGTDSSLSIYLPSGNQHNWENPDLLLELQTNFANCHRDRYGFIFPDRQIIVEAIAVEVILSMPMPIAPTLRTEISPKSPPQMVKVFSQGQWRDVPIVRRKDLTVGDRLTGMVLIVDDTGTNVIESGWEVTVTESQSLVLQKIDQKSDQKGDQESDHDTPQQTTPVIQEDFQKPDPIKLEIFNNLFQAIAEQMGFTLQNTSASVNIRERLDFSCAIFDHRGELIANAPHIPVHLGSMGESVKSLIHDLAINGKTIQQGDVFATNNPYNGGTHLPDLTVITPVFVAETAQDSDRPTFYVASRGHHADIGGITPGSMPSHSTNINQEGILFDNFPIVQQGEFGESEIIALLTSSPYPARNPQQNIADIQAQIAANQCGATELQRMVQQYGIAMVLAYMQHVRNNAEMAIRQAIANLSKASGAQNERNFTYHLDSGSQIVVSVTLDPVARTAKIDFTGTSAQLPNNFNAPLAVCKAVVLYVFRTLVEDDIPLNAGCLEPLEIIVPAGSLLNPMYPAAVVAGNVETSQAIANALYGALGVMAASQGTMNNFTFGNDRYQYYETICGGSGAGIDQQGIFDGTDAVQTHMTNSRLTDPEILEWRYPVILQEFAIRRGSGGQGQGRGGDGVIRKVQFREAMTAAILSSSRVIPPFGLQGGASGHTGQNYLIKANGSAIALPSIATVEVDAGDILVIATPGGGGYGQLDT